MREANYLATPEDGREILRILESSAAKGSMELLYTRRPDAYESYMREPGESRVFVTRSGGRVIGTCAELIREVYIGGEARRAAYLCGLKKDAAHEGGMGYFATFMHGLQRDDIDYYYCSVVTDNEEAKKLFGRERRSISMKPMAEYRTYIFNPKVKIRAPKHSLTFRQAEEADVPALIGFLNREGSRKDLFPVVRSLEQFYNLTCRDFWLLLDGEEIVATAALWNQTPYKQYVVKRYRGLMRLARIANPLLSALRYIRLPKEDAPLDFPMLSFFLCRDDREEYYRVFLQEITKKICERYGIFVIGLPKEHCAAALLEESKNIHFDTVLYEITFPRSGQEYAKVDPHRLFPECGLL